MWIRPHRFAASLRATSERLLVVGGVPRGAVRYPGGGDRSNGGDDHGEHP